MAIKYFGADFEGVTRLERRSSDPSYVPARDDGRMYYNTTEQTIKFGGRGQFLNFDIPAGTVMMFGQSSAPAGWTKKTDWQDNSMLVFTTGNSYEGGTDDATADIDINLQSAGSHSHTVASHQHSITAEGGTSTYMANHRHQLRGAASGYCGYCGDDEGISGKWYSKTNNKYVEYTGGGNDHDHGGGLTGGTSPGTDTESAHVHSYTVLSPKYRTVIAASKN